ncbi:hypothetical protein PoB_001211100 [Plakobranchus ocellatus]|uniref:Uncharacterized protein n=1 Tax=Plakobranchus ocellatus TaxID=259542 RepID=A0AAV3YQM1_9GAST|nr:hypothetical protein PoB_001211100 [Plakobranchus ocellatus]
MPWMLFKLLLETRFRFSNPSIFVQPELPTSIDFAFVQLSLETIARMALLLQVLLVLLGFTLYTPKLGLELARRVDRRAIFARRCFVREVSARSPLSGPLQSEQVPKRCSFSHASRWS